jgi:hypothetical protein
MQILWLSQYLDPNLAYSGLLGEDQMQEGLETMALDKKISTV